MSSLSWDSMKPALCGAIRSDTIIPKIVDNGWKDRFIQAYIPISLDGIFKGDHLVLESLSLGE